MTVDRRHLLAVTATTGLGLGVVAANPTRAYAAATVVAESADSFIEFRPSPGTDVTGRLQRTIKQAASLGRVIQIAPGVYDIGGPVRLLPNTKIVGSYGLATFRLSRNGAIFADGADGLVIAGLEISGASNDQLTGDQALVTLNHCTNLSVDDVIFDRAPVNALKLWRSSGRIERCRFERIGHTAIVSGNSTAGVDISHNRIHDAGNNGIVVWRDAAAIDGTIIANNSISAVRADSGGSGQNGNAINVFRAGNVIVTTNTIRDCAYSAVRCNSASNAQIIANNCHKIGEVALYAEFGFEGSVIASNVVDGAASGVVVTNFKEGGRLATVQGNIIRNLVRREHEAVDKRGIGIAIEADTIVNANTIEGAPTAGISVGWGQWLRQVAVSGNLIRDAGVGIGVSAKAKSGSVLITGNVISSVQRGGIRLADYDKLIGPELDEASAPGLPAVVRGNLMS